MPGLVKNQLMTLNGLSRELQEPLVALEEPRIDLGGSFCDEARLLWRMANVSSEFFLENPIFFVTAKASLTTFGNG